MRIPLAESEVGVVTKSQYTGAYRFYSKRDSYYINCAYRWIDNWGEMTFAQFKEMFPVETRDVRTRYKEKPKKNKYYYYF